MSKSETLFVKCFKMGSGIDTDEGTRAQWRYLESEGLVEKMTRSGRGILGHYFSYRITDTGREKLKELAQ